MKWFVKCFAKPNVDEFLTDIRIVEEAVKAVVPVVKEVLEEIK